ncbi:quercetin 2,3-dioxygenase [Thiopseudomonas alkaliphila]|uniref:Quercetin 2,3-dioxygenase n=1 Tax=Thiopseudomonas alkaliphila TaxID=1697053 RepID=A0A0K1XBG9_9GAMM|nr:pirin family protein [Thiopseudomonas alkaliphila]AKX58730.1 quercetin 2,3-dioxygenase [Thiopseudomonas alkaliphila]
MKTILELLNANPKHWVGNGFPVRTLFSYQLQEQRISPFLLLDHAAPTIFKPTTARRGVGQHPHRGFETVTLVYQGEVAHHDSLGQGGIIGPGDVQWMTAGAGILHEEYHSEPFAKAGGELHMVQLWVNLPARAKFTPARYQAITAEQIPQLELPDQVGRLRVIAGEYAGQQGPAKTHSPLQLLDMSLEPQAEFELGLVVNWPAMLVVLQGTLLVNQQSVVREGQTVLLSAQGDSVQLETNNHTHLLVLSGEPLQEPIVGYGPFVMNTEQQIEQALTDLQHHRLM